MIVSALNKSYRQHVIQAKYKQIGTITLLALAMIGSAYLIATFGPISNIGDYASAYASIIILGVALLIIKNNRFVNSENQYVNFLERLSTQYLDFFNKRSNNNFVQEITLVPYNPRFFEKKSSELNYSQKDFWTRVLLEQITNNDPWAEHIIRHRYFDARSMLFLMFDANRYNNPNLIRYTIRNNLWNAEEFEAFLYAVVSDNRLTISPEIISILLEAPQMTDKMRHEALVQSTVPVAQMLLAHTEFTWDVNFCSENSKHFGDNPLHYAVGIADLERIDFWISKIDCTRPNALGENLLERASRPYSVMIPSRDPNSSPGSWARAYALFMEELRNRVL